MRSWALALVALAGIYPWFGHFAGAPRPLAALFLQPAYPVFTTPDFFTTLSFTVTLAGGEKVELPWREFIERSARGAAFHRNVILRRTFAPRVQEGRERIVQQGLHHYFCVEGRNLGFDAEINSAEVLGTSNAFGAERRWTIVHTCTF